MQFEETSEETNPDEDCKMEVDSGADIGKKLELRKKEIAKQLRSIWEFNDLDEDFQASQKEKWQQGLLQIEKRRTGRRRREVRSCRGCKTQRCSGKHTT